MPRFIVEQSDIDYAKNPTPWDLGNQVLYDMCSEHPEHTTSEEVVSKIWLIGRSYAAAIERRKNSKDGSDDFYEEIVGPTISASNIDTLLSNLPACPADPVVNLAVTITTHKKITVLFESITGMEKRSLASKYLHFHRPDLFFIYDSRAQTAISKLTPDCRYIDCVSLPENKKDELYYKFCMRMRWLRKSIEDNYKEKLTPRELDKVLLVVHKRIG
jgi:hypothetical protein